MKDRNKVKKVSSARSIVNAMEELSYGGASLVALLAIEFNIFDYSNDGIFNSFSTYPKQYAALFVSPVIIGTLIKTLDKDSETAKDIDDMLNGLKPKTLKRK